MFSRLFKIIASQMIVLGTLSLCLAPISNASAYYQDMQDVPMENVSYDSYPCEAPCQPKCCTPNKWLLLGGAAALGAAAGAATGAAVGGGRGRTGAAGADAEFAFDPGQSLIFSNALTVAAGTGTAVAFVSLPDGTVIETAPIAIAGAGLIAFPDLVVSPALFGTYTAGVQITSGAVAVTGTLLTTVTASRDGSVTTIANAIPAVGIIGTQTQTSADFTYGAPPLP